MSVQKWIFHNLFSPRQVGPTAWRSAALAPYASCSWMTGPPNCQACGGIRDSAALKPLTLQRPRNIRNADPGEGSAGSGLEAVHSRQRIFVCDSLRPKVLLRPPFSSPRPPRVRSSVGLPRAPRVRSSAGFRARALCAEGRTGGDREIHWKL